MIRPHVVALSLVALTLTACGSRGASESDVEPAAPKPAAAQGSADGSAPPFTADAAAPAAPALDATAPDVSLPDLSDAGSVPAPACTTANAICLAIAVPPTVDAAKVAKLYIGFSKSKGGMPEIGKGTTLQPFAARPGVTMPLTVENKGLNGAFYINVGMYMTGGGFVSPKAGVDYVQSTSQAITLSSAPTAVGEVLRLELAR